MQRNRSNRGIIIRQIFIGTAMPHLLVDWQGLSFAFKLYLVIQQ